MAIPVSQLSRPRTALWAASAAGGFGQSLAGSAGALLVERIGAGAAAAGLPQALLVVGAAVSALGLSRLAARAGRGVALAGGAVLAALGALVVAVGGSAGWLLAILAGNLLLGSGTSTVMLGRYAAAALAPESARGRAMAGVLVATTVGAVAGPNLLAASAAMASRLGLVDLIGPYLVATAAFLVAGGVLTAGLAGLRHLAPPVTTSHSCELVRRPPWLREVRAAGMAGLAVLSLANLVMVAVMTMAPIQVHHAHGGLAAIGLLVSAHIAGMYAPSPASGWLVDRVGPAPTALLAGGVLVVACAGAAASSPSMLIGSMVLVGVGWNLALLAGSALLTAGVSAERRPRREGWGEAGMGVAAAVGGAASGVVLATAGYPPLAVGGALVSALLVPVAWLARSREAGVRPETVRSAQPLVQMNDHRVPGTFVDRLAQPGPHRQLVRAVTERHERAPEGAAIDRPSDLDQAAGTEELR
jgi:MFS family permease